MATPPGPINNATTISRVAKVGTGALAVGAVAAAGYIGYNALTGAPASSSSRYMGNYRFPKDLINPEIDRNFYIDIKFQDYQRRSIFQQPFLKAKGGIQLPIPSNLKDRFGVSWKEERSDGALGAGIEQFLKEKNNITSLGGSTPVNSFGSLASRVGSLATSAVAVGGAALGAGLISTVNAATRQFGNQALQLAGLAQNPFMTVLFSGPQYKSHTFTWDLAPRNAEESQVLMKIINAFRSNMLPSMMPGTAGVFLQYPNMAMITLYPNEDFLYKFKPCVIENLEVDFAPGGTPSFFKGTNAPTLVRLAINFKEIEYWLKEDIEDPEGGMRASASFFGNAPALNKTASGRAAGPV